MQEAVSNAVKHSGGSTIEVSLDCDARELRLSVKDDGVGFLAPGGERSQPGHYGLIGMRERASQINATIFNLTANRSRGNDGPRHDCRWLIPDITRCGSLQANHLPHVSTES